MTEHYTTPDFDRRKIAAARRLALAVRAAFGLPIMAKASIPDILSGLSLAEALQKLEKEKPEAYAQICRRHVLARLERNMRNKKHEKSL